MIAATCKLANKGDFWGVPSQTGQGKYFVRPNQAVYTCCDRPLRRGMLPG